MSFGGLFGPSRAEVWKQLARELGGEYTHSFWRGSQLYAKAGGWTVHLDIRIVPIGKVMIPFTRARTRFLTRDGLRFRIYRETFISELGKLLGMQDITIGDPEFDDRFIIKSNNEERVKQVLANGTLRKLLLAQTANPDLQVNDRTNFGISLPEGTFELHFQVPGTVKDLGQLKGIYEVFGETLEQLTKIGSAEPAEDPEQTGEAV